MKNKAYLCIDLKSFYASAECVSRGLDPMTTNLVVADDSRTEKTICLAVTPSLKVYGISGRSRLFEVVQRVKEVNRKRQHHAPGKTLTGESYDADALKRSPELALGYIIAPPRMAYYMEFSTRIYEIYLKYVAPEDIHVYSIDEVFMDVTKYLSVYNMTAREFAVKIVHDVLHTTGITATAGIGTNLYLAKIAMDIGSKHAAPDQYGVRIAELDEMSYRRTLWNHRPLTDFWRIGRGYAKKLEAAGLYTMGDVAKCSVGKPSDYYNEDFLYKMFGINAELLIDHAWGWEPCGIEEIKAFKPSTSSLGSGQVLHCPYDYEKTKLIIREMTELLALELVDKKLVASQMVMSVGYDIKNLDKPEIRKTYKGEVTKDQYGRKIPKPAHGTVNLKRPTSSAKLMIDAVMELYERIMNQNLLVRRVNITANHVVDEQSVQNDAVYMQMDLFTDYEELRREEEAENRRRKKERKIQEAILGIKKQYGKNAILKGMDMEEGATTISRNQQIGGHKA